MTHRNPSLRQPSTKAGRNFIDAVGAAVLDPSVAKMLGGDGVPQLVALVSVDAIRDAILDVEAEARREAAQ